MEGHDSELHIQLRGDLVYSLGVVSRSRDYVLGSPSAIMLRLALQALECEQRSPCHRADFAPLLKPRHPELLAQHPMSHKVCLLGWQERALSQICVSFGVAPPTNFLVVFPLASHSFHTCT